MSAAKLRALAETDVLNPIPSDTVQAALTSPPFVYVPGTFNTRDVGLVPTSTGEPSKLRPGFVYRSGGLERLTDDGKSMLANKLGIKKIFDLRSNGEHGKSPDPEIPGIENVWSSTGEQDAQIDPNDFVDGLGESGYVKMYFEVLDLYPESFRTVLTHVRDHPDEPFLFHCTAGRDRTGVLSGMLLALAGADPDTVSLDWLLSRIGTEPAREQLLAFVKHAAGVESTSNPTSFHNIASLREVCWKAFLSELESKYGGFAGWVTKVFGFSDDDLKVIAKNLGASA
ncbi:protein-tyrosine phosphatase-like protein [Coniochaeta sp. 2T2.1]|nr:protein-tyrosine phosphatase-like protein [Coniochaeta sp. 2T2.1]